MGPREGPLLAFGAVALAVGLAILDTRVERAAFDLSGFALELLEWAGIVGGLVAAIAALRALRRLRTDQAGMREDLALAVAPGASQGLYQVSAHGDPAASMRHQFESWELTPAEADIAALILKGARVRDIALLRGTSEATIRQQAQGIYRKAGLGGRAELAAFFLESLSESAGDPAGGPADQR